MFKKLHRAIAGAAVLGAAFGAQQAHATGEEPFLGDVMPVAFNFCPRGWTGADGQLLPIAQNQALYSLYGTTYGGDGRSTFGLPDLRGRQVVGAGSQAGTRDWSLGEKYGAETVYLTPQNLPTHKHGIVTRDGDEVGSAVNAFIAKRDVGINVYHTPTTSSNLSPMISGTLANTGGGQGVDVKTRFLAIKWCVSLQGLFPPRN